MENNQKKILVVEDDQFLREFYQELLADQGYLVDVASDGELALQKIRTQDYDLVLLDIMMPKKDGIGVLSDLKVQGPKSTNLTVVMLTNLGQDTVIKQCFEMGASGYLIKSALNPDQVLAEVEGFLKKSNG